jgi:putative restriction endonuclease
MVGGLSNDGKDWTEEQTIAACDLYLRYPSKLSKTDKSVIELANIIEKKPSAVYLKMCNIAKFDPNGGSSMDHSGQLDQIIWNKFMNDPIGMSKVANDIVCGLSNNRFNGSFTKPLEEWIIPRGIEKEVIRTERINQSTFRYYVLSAYGGKCCITGISEPKLLIASHIKPWSKSDPETERIDPRNGLCLNALHDRAFDVGLITVNASDYKLKLSKKIEKAMSNEEYEVYFRKYDGVEITPPDRYEPDRKYLEYHNIHIFEKDVMREEVIFSF